MACAVDEHADVVFIHCLRHQPGEGLGVSDALVDLHPQPRLTAFCQEPAGNARSARQSRQHAAYGGFGVAVVALEGRDRLDLMKAVSVVIRADGTVAPEERAYALRVATQLGLSWTEVLDLVGVPARATTNTQPRPVTRP